MINKVSAVCVCVCVLSQLYQNRKEERTGLIPCASPYRLPKGGLRHSENFRGLSDFIGGGIS